MAIYFTSENYLKQMGVITANVDATDFMPLVEFAARAFVQKQIGSYFFNDLLTKYNAQTLSADEITLVEYMQMAIAWRAVAHAGITLTYQLKNKGYQKQNGDNSESVELKEAQFMFNHYIQQAILFEAELKEYLSTNKDLYPNFLSTDNKDSSIKNACCSGNNNYNEGVGFLLI